MLRDTILNNCPATAYVLVKRDTARIVMYDLADYVHTWHKLEAAGLCIDGEWADSRSNYFALHVTHNWSYAVRKLHIRLHDRLNYRRWIVTVPHTPRFISHHNRRIGMYRSLGQIRKRI